MMAKTLKRSNRDSIRDWLALAEMWKIEARQWFEHRHVFDQGMFDAVPYADCHLKFLEARREYRKCVRRIAKRAERLVSLYKD